MTAVTHETFQKHSKTQLLSAARKTYEDKDNWITDFGISLLLLIVMCVNNAENHLYSFEKRTVLIYNESTL